MSNGFQTARLKVEFYFDGINFNLLEYLYFKSTVWGLLRTMTSSDGLSVPQALWSIIPNNGKLLYSGILHDGAFRNNLEVQNPIDSEWSKLTLNEQQSNDLIKEAAISQGATEFELKAIYDALQLFGWRAFDEDRKAICPT